MTDLDFSTEMEEQDFDEYLEVCFAVSGGFSKGTANVSAADVKKLHPLLSHYAKMKHPFTACVRDNRKRFGPKTEAYCAVLKDLIVGSTNWRGKGKKYTPHNLSEMTDDELKMEFGDLAIEFPEGFAYYLSELTEGDIQLMINSIPDTETADFAEGDVVWDYSTSYDKIRSEINDHFAPEQDGGEEVYGHSYWVEDLNSKEALVCYQGKDYFVVPYSTKKGGVTVSEEGDWKPVEKAWVESQFADTPTEVSELFFADEKEGKALEEDGLIWKSILREGEWQYSPGPRGAIKKGLKIVKSGPSDRIRNIISMDEIKANFEQNAFEHVTVPLSHKDLTHENTGYVRKLREGKDAKGRHILEAGIEFTEPEIKEKILRGSIPNCSSGILWNQIDKENGKRFNTVIGHLALVPHPYITELAPFSEEERKNYEVSYFSEGEIGENVEVITLSNDEVNTNIEIPRGGGNVSTETTTTEPEVITVVDRSFFEELGLGEDEIKSIVADYSAVKAEQRKATIDAKGKTWQEAGKSPALVKAAKQFLFADDETLAINFSDDGVAKTVSLSEVVEALVEASPSINFEDLVSEEDAAGVTPPADASLENERAEFSEEILSDAALLFLDGGGKYTEEEALKEAVKRSKS